MIESMMLTAKSTYLPPTIDVADKATPCQACCVITGTTPLPSLNAIFGVDELAHGRLLALAGCHLLSEHRTINGLGLASAATFMVRDVYSICQSTWSSALARMSLQASSFHMIATESKLKSNLTRKGAITHAAGKPVTVRRMSLMAAQMGTGIARSNRLKTGKDIRPRSGTHRAPSSLSASTSGLGSG